MRAKLRFWCDDTGARWLRMSLSGYGWTPDWSVPYPYLKSWGILAWFAVPPAESEGLQADRDYRMSDTPDLKTFDALLDWMHQLIAAIKPAIQPRIAFSVEDERDY